MSVDLVTLPNEAYNRGKGWSSKRCFNNDITRLRNAAEQRVQRSLTGWREYTVPFDSMSPSDFAAWYTFLTCRGANARPFLIWDPTAGGLNAYVAGGAVQTIGTGNGSQTAFQLTQTFADSVNPVVETVLHPVPTGSAIPPNLLGALGWSGGASTTNTVKVNGVTKTEGTDYTISPSTGLVTFSAAPASGQAVTW